MKSEVEIELYRIKRNEKEILTADGFIKNLGFISDIYWFVCIILLLNNAYMRWNISVIILKSHS